MNPHGLLDDVRSMEFWQQFAPELSITTDRAIGASDSETFQPESLSNDLEHLRLNGYCMISEVIPESQLEVLRSCVERLQADGMLPVFLFVYDEPWKLLMNLNDVLSRTLQGEFLILPSVYAWFVDGENQNAFPPHRDLPYLKDLESLDGSPNYLTLWIPLTNATTNNSCIHLVPKNLDPNYPDKQSDPTISAPDSIRPLPAPPGSLLFWNLGILHWGSRASSGCTPRISIAYYLQRADRNPLNYPCVELRHPLSFELRLALIGKQILSYYRGHDPGVLAMGHQLEALHLETRRARLMKDLWRGSRRMDGLDFTHAGPKRS